PGLGLPDALPAPRARRDAAGSGAARARTRRRRHRHPRAHPLLDRLPRPSCRPCLVRLRSVYACGCPLGALPGHRAAPERPAAGGVPRARRLRARDRRPPRTPSESLLVSLTLVGLSHQATPIAVRERAFVPLSQAAELAGELAGDGEAVCLSTCNRTELYVIG